MGAISIRERDDQEQGLEEMEKPTLAIVFEIALWLALLVIQVVVAPNYLASF